MHGKCKLYDTDEELRESHIYPKFVIDHLKLTGSKFLRNFSKPDRRKQDGPKVYLLSEKAEQDFSKREKWFSEKIFKEYLENRKTHFEYDENLFYFTTSFLWRILIIHLNHPNIIGQPYINQLHEVAAEWKAFLRDFKYPVNYDRFYIFLTDRVKSHNLNVTGVDYYTSRALDATIISNDDQTFLAVYGKFLRFAFWGIIRGGDETKISDLKINPLKGLISVPQKITDPEIIGFFINRIKEIENLPKPSEKQQQKIVDEILKDKEGFLKSDVGKSIINDHFNLDNE